MSIFVRTSVFTIMCAYFILVQRFASVIPTKARLKPEFPFLLFIRIIIITIIIFTVSFSIKFHLLWFGTYAALFLLANTT